METRSYINNMPTDRGWAWIVMIAVMVTSLLEMGMIKSFGLFFVEFQKKFDTSSSDASLPTSVHGFTVSLSALPIMTIGQEKLGCRQCVIIGGIFLLVGFLLTSIAPNMAMVVFCQGLLVGLGSAFIHGPSLSIIGQYFHKRLGLANGMCNCFGSFGAIILPIIVNALFKQFGYFGAFLILSSIFFQCTLCGAFMRPESYYSKTLDDMKLNTDDGTPANITEDVDSGRVSIQSAVVVSTNDLINKRGNKTFKKFSKLLDLKTLKNPLALLFMCVFSFGSIGCNGAVIFIPPYADERGIPSERIAELVTIYGVASCIGRLIVGIIADYKILQRYKIIMIAVFMTGIMLMFSELCTDFWSFSVFTFLYGFSSGTLATLFVPVCIDFLGPDNFKSAVGLLVSVQGLIFAASIPTIGAMKDSLASYVYGFYFMGVITILASPLLFIVPLIKISEKKKESCAADC